jgi:hypothetical protein
LFLRRRWEPIPRSPSSLRKHRTNLHEGSVTLPLFVGKEAGCSPLSLLDYKWIFWTANRSDVFSLCAPEEHREIDLPVPSGLEAESGQCAALLGGISAASRLAGLRFLFFTGLSCGHPEKG